MLKEFGWIPNWFLALPKKRDLGCSLMCVAGLYVVGINAPWWTLFLSVGLMWGALSTYWQKCFKGVDNHYAHGFGVGLACFPIAFFDEPVALVARVILLAFAMGIWSEDHGNATIEELGRGAFIPLTLGSLWLI